MYNYKILIFNILCIYINRSPLSTFRQTTEKSRSGRGKALIRDPTSETRLRTRSELENGSTEPTTYELSGLNGRIMENSLFLCQEPEKAPKGFFACSF